MIKAITFDLDGVYFPDGKAKFIASLAEFGIDETEAKRVFLKSEQMNRRYKVGKMSDSDFWNWASEEWDIALTAEDIMARLIDSYRMDPEVVDLVRTVRSAGYKTMICSNNFPARINGLNTKFHFLDDFDVVVLSYEVGTCKPDSKIFSRLIELSGVNADEILFADDDPSNLMQAKELGITTYAYQNFDGFIAELKAQGVKW